MENQREEECEKMRLEMKKEIDRLRIIIRDLHKENEDLTERLKGATDNIAGAMVAIIKTLKQ